MALWIYFISWKIYCSFKLLLIASILDHILIILKIPWLEVLLQRLNLISIQITSVQPTNHPDRPIRRRFLVLSEGPLGNCIVDSWSLLKDLAVKYILALISLVQDVLMGALFGCTTTVFELLLLVWQILVLLDLLLSREFQWNFIFFISIMTHINLVHCLYLGKCMCS